MRPAGQTERGPSRFALRATLFLVAAAVLYGILAVLARLAAPDDSDVALALLGILPIFAGMLAAIWGMNQGFAWAEVAALGIMWLMVIEGVVQTIGACVAGPATINVHIPIGAIAAALLLWTSAGLRDRRPLSEGQQGCAAIVITIVAAGMLWPFLVGLMFAAND